MGRARGAKKMYYGRSEMANWQYMYVVYVSREFKESYTRPDKAHCPCAFAQKAPNKVVGAGGIFRPRDP